MEVQKNSIYFVALIFTVTFGQFNASLISLLISYWLQTFEQSCKLCTHTKCHYKTNILVRESHHELLITHLNEKS